MRGLGTIGLFFLTACASQATPGSDDVPPETGCSDQDADGFGIGTECDGPDCNDLVADIHEDAQCAEWCATHDVAPGCACTSAEPTACYLGPEGSMGPSVPQPNAS